jgi:hypothetical protein
MDEQEIAAEKRQWNAERDDRLQQERKKYEVRLECITSVTLSAQTPELYINCAGMPPRVMVFNSCMYTCHVCAYMRNGVVHAAYTCVFADA